MTSEKGCKKDKNQNIQVFVRLRPLNQRERDIKSLGVVDVINSREVFVKFSQQTSITKKFTFDKAFGPNANQVEVYQEVVSPLIEEVLAGYNCTVFAYGQTGTGKTHTMVGEHTIDETNWQKDPLAGIIPRALSQLFDELRISNTEYTVRVSYLELYNEELFDLLSSSEDNSKLRIYEDVTRKGSNIVNGLEEVTVYNKKEVYKIMAQGQERKRVASTLMNAQSSRSHTVFTIVVHMKENSPEGEELVKIGKLNLVDLAGSENISKAGSDNPAKKERARECVNINQSLLTLGRVITALVERHPHVPYRESKLTRILQESLGGRTKTSIIATISPGHKDLEETLSTLEYAHRAKNIQNKPEVNQKMTKKAILKEYAEEIDKLKRDLQAARDKNGVYLANETFTEMTLKQEEQKKEIQELLLRKRAMEEERDRMEGLFSNLNHMLESRDTELNITRNKLKITKKQLSTTNNMLQSARTECSEQQQLVQHHGATERALSAQAQQLLAAADVATTHVACLHDNVDKRRSLESSNLQVTRIFQQQSAEQRERVATGVKSFSDSVTSELSDLQAAIENFIAASLRTQGGNRELIEELAKNVLETLNELTAATAESLARQLQAVDSHRCQMEGTLTVTHQETREWTVALLKSLCSLVTATEGVDVKGKIVTFIHKWYEGLSERVSAVRRCQSEFESRLRQAGAERELASRAQGDSRRAHAAKIEETILKSIAQVESEKEDIEKSLLKKLEEVETERQETESRLEEWVEEKRRLLEEEITRHVAREKTVLENRLKKRMEEIEEDKKLLENRISRFIELQQKQLEMIKLEVEMVDRDVEDSHELGEKNKECINKYGKEIDNGTSAIAIDMEAFSRNVVEVVQHVDDELMQTLTEAKDQIQSEVETLVESDRSRCDRLRDTVSETVQAVLRLSEQLNNLAVQRLQANNTMTARELSKLASSTSELMEENQSHLGRETSALNKIKDEISGLRAAVLETVEKHGELEKQYLSREYRLYSPTGKTPSRTEYRYPRTLAATSPHERILARIRALRQTEQNEDCAVSDNADSEAICLSDSESSMSEDSALFAAPSPPAETLLQPPAALVKSTSETDIYAIRKKQDLRGKENSLPLIVKKGSKLPAPTSIKKPLVERNAIVN